MPEDSLLNLLNSEVCTLHHLLFYLNKSRDLGLISFIVNKLFAHEADSIEKYLPQLFNLAMRRGEHDCVKKLLIEKAIQSHRFALKLYWFLSSAEDFASIQSISGMLHDLEMAIVNATLPQQETLPYPPCMFSLDFQEDELALYSRKKVHADYFQYEHKALETLCKISIALLIQPEETRESQLKNWLQSIENWIIKNKNKEGTEYEKRMFRGVFLPMQIDSPNPQVMRVIPEEAICFKTKARVPFKVLLEIVDLAEDEQVTVVEDTTIDAEGIEQIERLDMATIGIENPISMRHEGLAQFEEGEVPPEENLSSCSDMSPWGELWNQTCARIRNESPFSNFQSWQLKAFIVKGLDDLRQEHLAMQLILKFKEIFDDACLPLFLRPYDILVVSSNMGIIEFIPNTQSIHGLKKRMPSFTSLYEFFIENWGENFEEAQKNFVESMAAYSLVCYILNIKDRHNANILLDTDGHIIHIDFGFFLTRSPGGNISFESAPFKLTKEYIEVMGEIDGEMFQYFKVIMYRGFLEIRKRFDELILIIEMMGPSSHLPCLSDFDRAIFELRERLFLSKTDEACMLAINNLVKESADNWKTIKYDSFQRYSNGIL